MKKHKFTWLGKPVTSCFLSQILDVSIASIYYAASDCSSDCGEDIKAHIDKTSRRFDLIEFDRKMRSRKKIAKRTGISAATLRYRTITYGPDCCLTYFPGRIPSHLLPPKKKRTVPIKTAVTSRSSGNSLWNSISGKKRDSNVNKIKIGLFERGIPCPSAGTGNANEYI